MNTARRIAAFATALAIVMVALVATPASASVPEITGTTSDSGWRDLTLNANAKVGVAYSDTILGPSNGGPYSVDGGSLPDGLSASIDSSTGRITISGTPTSTGPFDFTINYSASNGENNYSISFSGFPVDPDTVATTTTVTTDAFSPYTAVNLNAAVSSNTSGGTVDFYLDATLVGSGTVTGVGTASYSGAVPASFVGSSPVVKAVFSGDATFATSTSTSDPTVYVYGARVISGTFTNNGEPVVGETIRLFDSSGGDTVGLSDTTDVSGAFQITLPTPTSALSAQAGYVIGAVGSGVYYAATAGPAQPNVTDVGDASVVTETRWASPVNLYLNVNPTWTDQTLHQPRVGSAYSDSVVAVTTGTPTTITYSVTGDVPDWLSVTGGSVGASNPTDQNAHTFTVRATSTYGYIEKAFTLTAGAAGVAPVFNDTTIPDLQVGRVLTDGVSATGDAAIVYTSTALPGGLTLNSATGALTGIPTTAGDYTVVFTATNDFGDDTFTWEPTIAAAPEISLVLNFVAGDAIGDAGSVIGASGLQVGSTYTLDLHSSPIRLYTGTVDGTGGFTWLVTLPADTPVGAHELILTGVAPDGTVMTAHAWFTLLANGHIGAVSYSGALPFRLAFTGSEPMVPLGIASAMLLAGYLLLRRRRVDSEQA